MADVFISYASEDRERVRSLREALEASGYTVWWDRRLAPGTSFDREIERELSEASCVIVVWSIRSVESDWVREEAADGLQREILVPVQIDDCQIPLGFRRAHAAQLIGWPKGTKDPSEVFDRVGKLVGRSTPSTTPLPKKRWPIFASVAAALLAVAVLAISYYNRYAPTVFRMVSEPAGFFGEPVEQQLSFTTTSDGVRIAYAVSGQGPPIVHVLTAFSNLESGYNSPVYDSEDLIRMSSRNNSFVRYDGRGSGLSDHDVEDLSLAARLRDLEAVADALELEQFGLIASSAGGLAAIAFAAENPQRVTRLVLAGCSATYRTPETDGGRAFDPMMIMIETAWDGMFPIASNGLAEMLLYPDGDELDYRFLGEMLRRSTNGPQLARFFRANLQIDVTEEARRIVVPTLVIQARDDPIATLEQGRALAALIPGAKLEIYDGGHFMGTTGLPQTRQRALEFVNTGK